MEKVLNNFVVLYVCFLFFFNIYQLFFIKEVEPMARESDNIHIIALTKAAAVPLRVIYMDRSQQSTLTVHDFPATDEEKDDTFQPMITMLYRPGHYDLLYEN